ncbi:unnamed protein product [Adineta steineri]|uniref:Uncharacterized protein n=1 Tax=Adineta steineri TaxID=433720 RepID=A0A815B0H2_9BILA|nr:unnamed protein product [Adineta steineri]CAF1552286.1 unnamed protein product [Adineta steineri]
MLSSFSKLIHNSRFSLSLIKQQCSFISTSSIKNDLPSRSSDNNSQKNKNDTHDPQIDSSHQSGTISQKERTAWEKAEHDITSNKQITPKPFLHDQKNNTKAPTQ